MSAHRNLPRCAVSPGLKEKRVHGKSCFVVEARAVRPLRRPQTTVPTKSKLRGTLRTLREAIAKGDNGELMKVYELDGEFAG